MENQHQRTISLIGEENFKTISTKKVLVFGIGGVGGYVAEMLARAGIGEIAIIDFDSVSLSNINRQIIATHSTIGEPKVNVMKKRILDINPNIKVTAINKFVSKDNITDFNPQNYDYVVDAIDNVSAKIALAKLADTQNFNLISCMGTGNKLCPELFEITDIYKTSVCPLAKVIRKELKALGVKKLTVLYSKEQPINNGSRTPASICFTPSIAGIRIAEHVIKSFFKLIFLEKSFLNKQPKKS